jgi:uncharacterized surface anchored protein
MTLPRQTTSTVATTEATTTTTFVVPPLPSCRDVLAAPVPRLGSANATISVPGLPTNAKVQVVVHHNMTSNGFDVRNCSSVRTGSGTEVLTQDVCCNGGELVGATTFTITLRSTPPPGARFCEQAAVRDISANGGVPEAAVNVTNRICKVMPSSTTEGQLPFTGAGLLVPLLLTGVAVLALGGGALLLSRRRSHLSWW